MAKPTLYLMLGYPGAGKTTAARIIEALTGAIRLSSDQYRAAKYSSPSFTQSEHDEVYQSLNALAEQHLRSGKSVIYDANLNRFIHRKEKYELCKRTDANAQLVWVQTPADIAKSRATTLGDSDPHRPFGNLDGSVFDRLAREIEPPTQSEQPIILDGTKLTPEYIREQLQLP